MNHTIEVHLAANIEKYKQGMDAAKKVGNESMGVIASIFDKVKSMFGGLWDSFKSLFSSTADKSKASLGAMNGDLDKSKNKMGEVDEKTTGLIAKIGIALVAAFVAATGILAVFVKRGLEAEAALARMAIANDIAVSQISRFDDVAARSGVSVKDLGASIGKFQDEMKKAAAGDGNSIFDKLGVKVVDANNALLKTDEVTIAVAKKIAAMSSEAEKYDAAAKLGFGGKVQLLEDIAHASNLTASTTDDQAAAVVRLGKIWHEILPGGKGMWAEVSTFLTNSLTPAMTAASVKILESKNTIVDAFNQIFGTGSMFPAFGDKIKSWAEDANKWFSNVADSAVSASVSIMKFIAQKTGLGDPNAYVKGSTAPGYVPGTVALASGKNDPIVKDSTKKQIEEYDALTKVIKDKIEVQRQEIQMGDALTDGQKMALKMAADLRDGTSTLTAAQKVQRTEQYNSLIALEKQNASMKESKAASAADAKKEAESYATLIAAIRAKTAENKLEVAYGSTTMESARMRIKLDQEQAAGKHALSAAHLAVARAALNEQEAAEQLVLTMKTEKQVMELITQSTISRQEANSQIESEYALYGKSNDAREIAMVAIKSEVQYQKDLDAVRKAGGQVTEEVISQLKKRTRHPHCCRPGHHGTGEGARLRRSAA